MLVAYYTIKGEKPAHHYEISPCDLKKKEECDLNLMSQ